ncbi:MAG: hypothetical protein IPK63_18870 [Candidatus Competibacteraceae bacterium]|nr:hypothetical protein [Candidatus Competibacteraceae bacterium]
MAANVGLGFLGGAMLAVNGALAIAGPAISAVGTASSALATGLSGAGGLIAAMGPAGLAAAALAAVASYTVLETSKRNQIALTKELKDNIGPLVDKIEKEAEAAKEVRLRIDGILDARAEEARKTDGVSESLDRLTKYWKEQGYAYDTATGAITKLNVEQGKFFDDLKFKDINNVTLDTYIDKTGQLVTTFDQIGGGTVKATGAFAAVKDKTEEAKESLDKLIESGKLTTDQFIEVTKNANDFKAKMEEIASNERIKNIEAYVTLNVADLEAQAKIVEATFASIDNTVSSTGDLLGSLFGGLANADTYSRLKIESQIDLENKRRDAALELQKKLTQAEIDNINAKTRALDRGDAVIKVSGDNLEPYLKSIMFELFKAIRIEVNADAADFLLAGG